MPLLSQFLLLDDARNAHLARPRQHGGLDVHHRALMQPVHRQPMHRADARAAIRLHRRARGIVPGLHHPCDVLRGDVRPAVQLRKTRAHLHDVDGVTPAGGVPADDGGFLRLQCVARALRRAGRDDGDFIRREGAEEYLHAAGAQGGRNLAGAAGGRADEAEISRQAVGEDLADVARDAYVIGVVVRRLKHDAAVFEDLEELVHLHGVQFADLIKEEHAAVSLRHRAGLRLRDALHPQRTCALVDGVMHAAQKGIGDGALVETDAGGVDLDERGVLAERRALRLLGGLQHQPRGARFADAGRAVNQHVLRVRAAEDRLE